MCINISVSIIYVCIITGQTNSDIKMKHKGKVTKKAKSPFQEH